MPLDRRLAGVSPETLLALATAAGAAPLARQRWVSVGDLFRRAVALDSAAGRALSADRLEGLLGAAARDDPRLQKMEDVVPLDPREAVVERVGDELLRLFPGCTERPVADARRWTRVADACDPSLVPTLGFGVTDYTRLALRHNAQVIAELEPNWPAGDVSLDDPPRVTEAEVAAAGRLIAQTAAHNVIDDPAQAALTWATADVRALPYDPTDPNSPFGRYLAVDRPGGAVWLPPAFVTGSINAGVVELAAMASRDTLPNLRWARLVASRVRDLLWPFGNLIWGPPDTVDGPSVDPGNVVQWLVGVDQNRFLAVQVVARLALGPDTVPDRPAAIEVARAARERPDRRVDVPMPRGTLRLDPGVEVIPVLVVAAAGYLCVGQRPGVVMFSLDDLDWIAHTWTAATDLWTFCRDVASVRSLVASEAIDVYEVWRAGGKSLGRGARAFDVILCEPHGGEAEWPRAAQLAATERALAATGLPPLREWAHVEGDGPPLLYRWSAAAAVDERTQPRAGETTAALGEAAPDVEGWQIAAAVSPPAAFACADPTWPHRHRDLLHSLAGALAWGVEAVAVAWDDAHACATVAGYRVRLDSASSSDAGVAPLRVARAETVADALGGGDVVAGTIAVDCDALADLAHRDIDAAKCAIAAAVADLVAATAGVETPATVQTAWEAAPPTLAVQIATGATTRDDLPLPWPLDDAMAAEVAREIARAVATEGVAPGVYSGQAATDLDRDILAPAALRALTSRLAVHPAEELVYVGLAQIDRGLAAADRQARDVESGARAMPVAYDPVPRLAEIHHKALTLRRSQELAIEAAVREQPTGTDPVTQVAWMEILAAANAYLVATTRSESVHHQVTPVVLDIDDMHEIGVRDDPAAAPAAPGTPGYALNGQALHDARAAERLADPTMLPSGAIALAPTGEDEAEPGGPAPAAAPPVFDPTLDAALLAEHGATGIDLASTLLALAHWPLADHEDIAIADRDRLLAYLADVTTWAGTGDGPARAAAAVEMLTTTAPALGAAEWRPWQARSRQRRLLIQPLVELGDGRLAVAPHLCHAAVRVYGTHLSQGQLPWTQPPPGAAVETALAEIRDRRNRALEREIEQLLHDNGWQVVARVRETDPQRLGVPALQTEIDVVAGRPGDPTLWLLEVKDPAGVYAIAEIRRHLDRFYKGSAKEPAYAAQLRRKHDDLAPHAAAVAAALGLPPAAPDRPYTVAPAFVTRRVMPAAHVGGVFLFTTKLALLKDLNSGRLLLSMAPRSAP